MSLDLPRVRELMERGVDEGRYPGTAVAVRYRGDTEVLLVGVHAVDDPTPVDEHSLWRLASLTKPYGAALALALVERGVVGLDDPVARWVPELAAPVVLVDPAGPLDDVVPAVRDITLRHVLTQTTGHGARFDDSPLARRMDADGIRPGAFPPDDDPAPWTSRLGALPLLFQPGDGWAYSLDYDLLGVLLTRAAGRSLDDLLAEHVTGPLGLLATTTWTDDAAHLTTAYQPQPDGTLQPLDRPTGRHAAPSAFPTLATGLVAPVTEVLAFFAAMADGGGPVLSAASAELLARDALSQNARARADPMFLTPGTSWTHGAGVVTADDPEKPWVHAGSWGWAGGTGTAATVDPARDLVAVWLTQRAMAGPQDGPDAFEAALEDDLAALD